MSFSNDVKKEIIENKPLRLRLKKEQAYGLLLYAKEFSADRMLCRTESVEVAELYAWFIGTLAGKAAKVETKERRVRGKIVYDTQVPLRGDRERVLSVLGLSDPDQVNEALISTTEQTGGFLAGAWLACGNITDPQKSYHLEFVCRTPELCRLLQRVLEDIVAGVRHTVRRGNDILYIKECAAIEDLLTIIGASKSSLAMIEVEIIKDVRNKANRVTNCETANIDKTVSAAAGQIEDIRYILERKGEEWLPANLLQAARQRMEYPELSLRELVELSPTPISRSGMHHRLDKLSRLAEQLRSEGRE